MVMVEVVVVVGCFAASTLLAFAWNLDKTYQVLRRAMVELSTEITALL